MITYVGIDGTSTEDDESYKVTYYNSFVNKLHRNEFVGFTNPWYLRGPFLSGFDTAERAKLGRDHAVEQWKSGAAKAIFLAGHSRGGAAVIEIAKWLKEDHNIPVECLILFDAVDRTHTLGRIFNNTPIPNTVKMVIHARRDIFRSQSRLTFGNCGTRFESSQTPLFQKHFVCTHSAVGGVPWLKAVHPVLGVPIPTIFEPGEHHPTLITPAKDQAGSVEVWDWASKLIWYAYYKCLQRLEQEKPVGKPDFQVTPQPGGSLPPTGGNGNQRIYIVQKGDWLSKIALKYYGDAMKYDIIHKANIGVIGPDPNRIEPGQRLVIPYI